MSNKQKSVPTSRFSRAARLGSLAGKVAGNMLFEGTKAWATGKQTSRQELLLQPKNIQRFVDGIIHGENKFQAIAWAPELLLANKEAYVNSMRTQGYPQFQLSEIDPQGNMVIAGERAKYYPVTHVSPYKENAGVLGFDLGSNTKRLLALELAIKSGEPVLSEPVDLVPLSNGNIGVLLVLAVYNKVLPLRVERQSMSELKGFAILAISIENIFDSITQRYSMDHQLYLFDESYEEI